MANSMTKNVSINDTRSVNVISHARLVIAGGVA